MIPETTTRPVAPERTRSALAPFLAYVVAFHLAWAAWPFWLYPRLVALGDTTLAYAAANIGIRLLVWVAPVWAYLKFVDGVDPLDYLKLRDRVPRGVLVAVALTALNFAGTMLRFGPPHPTLQRVTWNSVFGTSVLVGFIEEIPYRGFMLQKFGERFNFWMANLITSLLFLEVHVPGWIALHQLRADTAVTIFVFGFIMAVVFRYSTSLWAPIITHSTNDFMSFVLFRL
jgi:membrane protease YdiL (CAAX protease family)